MIRRTGSAGRGVRKNDDCGFSRSWFSLSVPKVGQILNLLTEPSVIKGEGYEKEEEETAPDA